MDSDGRIMELASRSSGTEASAASCDAGLNLSIRQFISATSSSPTRQTMCWLMNQPSPSPVCLGPTTSPISEEIADFLAGSQVPVVGLLAVRRDHADVAVVVEQLHDRAHGIVGRAFAAQAEHRPHLNHGRRRDNSGVADGAGRVLVAVDRVGVADGFDPAVDHRLVHRVATGARLGAAGRFDLRERLVDIRHLGTLGTLRPDAAIISRITSFTPPPKVITRLRLVCESSQSSSSAVSDSAGLPYLPTISSASRPMY